MFTPCNGPPLCFKPPYAGKTPSESSGSLLIASTPINANNARRCQLPWEAMTPERQRFDFFLPLQHTPKRSGLHLSRTRTYCFQHKLTQAWRVPAKDPALTLTKVCSAPPSTQHDSYLWPLSFQALERAETHQWPRAALLACCFGKKQCLRAALSRGIRRMQVSPALE